MPTLGWRGLLRILPASKGLQMVTPELLRVIREGLGLSKEDLELGLLLVVLEPVGLPLATLHWTVVTLNWPPVTPHYQLVSLERRRTLAHSPEGSGFQRLAGGLGTGGREGPRPKEALQQRQGLAEGPFQHLGCRLQQAALWRGQPDLWRPARELVRVRVA